MAKLIVKSPVDGSILKELETTPLDTLGTAFAQAREAQRGWAAVPLKQRAAMLIQLRETLLNHADEIAALISKENGKPLFEALSNEVFPMIDLLTYFAKRGPKILKDSRIPLHLMRHRSSKLNYWPLGVVAVISPWNYPFFLSFSQIAMAVVAGNAVIFKPSEVTPLIGLKIQALCDEAGFPENLIHTIVGDGAAGAAIIAHKPNKIFFTGSVGTGKKIMAAASENLIPVSLELGGKDAMIVLPDADLDFATSAALWGGFSNSGQICASVERILVHESIADEFLSRYKEKISKLRQDPKDLTHTDLGATTFEKQKAVYERQINQARAQGASFEVGGTFSDDRTYLHPTVVTGPNIESLDIYNEETFGPVVAITTFKTPREAVQKANNSPYGLLASVITRDLGQGERIARQLEVGTVTINEVTYTGGLAETPWGGLKDSGFGRVHADMGLYEFVNVRHIHGPIASFLTFKSPWWFPYTPFQLTLFRQFLELYRKSWLARLRAFPHVMWNLVQFLKLEKRL